MASKADWALKKAAAHWSTQPNLGKTRWWSSPTIHRHINRLVCGEAIDGPWAGLEARMREFGPFGCAVSVGCGNAWKELNLIRHGIVQSFDLYEISSVRVDQARERASALGVIDHVRFHVADAFAGAPTRAYNLVYWNSSLHHMLDVDQAVRWSRNVLRDGGYFVMDDFVGPTRWQWSDHNLNMVARVRAALPERLLRDPRRSGQLLPRLVGRPDPAKLEAADPSEAADSDAILPAVTKYFPDAEIIFTGGCLYHLALNDVLANMDDELDQPLLEMILLIDEQMAAAGHTHHAVAFATK